MRISDWSSDVCSSDLALMHALVKAGADVIELGVPFSDPMADGPVIQRAAERAIKRGVGLRQVLEMVAEFRKLDQDTPVVLMGYANPIERMGQAEFVQQAAQAGVDGVLVVDYPPEEVEEFAAQMGKARHDRSEDSRLGKEVGRTVISRGVL